MVFIQGTMKFSFILLSLLLTPSVVVVVEAWFIPSSSSGSSPTSVGTVSAGPLQISSIGCGTWSWGNRFLWNYTTKQDEELYQSYKVVRDSGITLFDTADSYGTLDLNGRSEVLLGQFEQRYLSEKQQQEEGIRDSNQKENKGMLFLPTLLRPKQLSSIGPPKQQQVATKLAPYPWRITGNSFVNAAEASLQRLQQDKMTICQLHWSTVNYQPLQELALWDGLRQIYEKQLCQAVGVSNYGPRQLEKIANYCTNNDIPLATAQIQYSLMTYSPMIQDMNAICNELGIRLIAYSPLCLGLLSCQYDTNQLPSFPRQALFRELLPSAQPLLQTLQQMAIEYNQTPAQIAINWTICKDTVPIPGCRTSTQAQSTIDVMKFRLKQDAIDELDRIALNIQKPMIQNIFQTN